MGQVGEGMPVRRECRRARYGILWKLLIITMPVRGAEGQLGVSLPEDDRAPGHVSGETRTLPNHDPSRSTPHAVCSCCPSPLC